MGMNLLIKKNRRSVLASLVIFIILTFMMLVPSYFLRIGYAESGDVCTGSNALVHFHPIINEYGSLLNLNIGLEYHFYLFVLECLLGLGMVLLFYFFQLYLRQHYHFHFAIWIPTILLATACFGRLVERILWKYTLDFIAIKNLGIWDIGDVYLFVGCIGFMISAGVHCKCEAKETAHMSKSERKQYRNDQYRGFLQLLLRNDLRG